MQFPHFYFFANIQQISTISVPENLGKINYLSRANAGSEHLWRPLRSNPTPVNEAGEALNGPKCCIADPFGTLHCAPIPTTVPFPAGQHLALTRDSPLCDRPAWLAPQFLFPLAEWLSASWFGSR